MFLVTAWRYFLNVEPAAGLQKEKSLESANCLTEGVIHLSPPATSFSMLKFTGLKPVDLTL
jgi:hypothetical protein